MKINFFIQRYLLIILFTFLYCESLSQKIYVGYGPMFSHTNQTLKLVNGKDDFSYHNMQKNAGVEWKLKNRTYLGLNMSNYEATTLMRLSSERKVGFEGTKITRIDLGLSYNLLKDHNRIFIKPSFAVGFQFARKQADLWGEQVHIYGPDYYQTRIPYSEGHNNFQFVPVAGLSMGVKFLKRCEAGISIHGVWGYKTFQRLYFYYNHKDSPTIERTAIFESRGTGINSAIFLGINISKKGNLK